MAEKTVIRQLIATLSIIFIITGLIAIVFQQIFEKVLGAVIGTSLVSASTVLGIFFAGIAIGSLSYGKLLRKLKSPLKVFVLGESIVGFWGLIVYFAFDGFNFWSRLIMDFWGANGIGLFIGSFMVTTIWALPVTFAMGLSFPGIIGILKKLNMANMNVVISRFYALNLLGATMGALVGIYWWFPKFGLIQTLVFLSSFEIVIAVFIWFYVSRVFHTEQIPGGEPHTKEIIGIREKLHFSKSHWILLMISFFSGFIVFSFEVIWNHLIGAALGNSVYSFANMLFAVLLGLFLASLINARVFIQLKIIPNYFILTMIQVAALCLCLTFLYWDHIPDILAKYGQNIDRLAMSPFLFGEFVRLRYCVIFITLPCIFLGMIYPYLFRSRWFPKEQPDRTVAWMSAINAIGSISGAFLTIFVFIPLFGSQESFKWLAVLFSLVACICFIYELGQIKPGIKSKVIRTAFQFGVLTICFFIVVSNQWNLKELTSGKNVYFTKMHVTDQSEMLFLQEGVVDGFVTVVRRNGINTLLTNGKFQGDDHAEAPAQISFALLPILHLKKIEKAAVIGLGTGQSAAVIKAAGFPSVDILELSPAVVNAATSCFSRSNRNIASARGVNLHVADGRTFLQLSENLFDLISIEVSSIWFAGATNIYSREFYEIAKSRLATDGVLQQWVQFHHIGLNEILSTIATVKDVFPYVSIWFSGGQGIMLASKKPLILNPKLKEQIKNREEMRYFFNVLQRWNINLHNLLRRKLLDMSDVDKLVQEAKKRRIPINTDKNRYLEFHTPRYNLERIDHRRIILQKLLAYQT